MRTVPVIVIAAALLAAGSAEAASSKSHRPTPVTVASAGKQDVEIDIAERAPAAPAPAPADQLDQGEVDSVVKAHLPLLEPCYQRDPLLPPLSGAVTVKFEVQPDGHVSRTKVLKSTVGDEAVSRCVAERFKMFHFPSPGGAAVILSYPVLIASAGR